MIRFLILFAVVNQEYLHSIQISKYIVLRVYAQGMLECHLTHTLYFCSLLPLLALLLKVTL